MGASWLCTNEHLPVGHLRHLCMGLAHGSKGRGALGASWLCPNDEIGSACRKQRDHEEEGGLKGNTEGKAQTTISFTENNLPLNVNE